MTHAMVSPIGPLREHAVQLAHALGQRRVTSLDQEVIVVAHQAVGMAHPAEPITDLSQHLKKHHPVGIVQIDILTTIAS